MVLVALRSWLTARASCVTIDLEFLNPMLGFIKLFDEFFHLSLGWGSTRFPCKLKREIVLNVRLHLIVLHDLRLHRIVLSQVYAELLWYFLPHEPLQRAFARSQKRRIILHLLNLYFNKLLIGYSDPLILVFVCRLGAWLQNHLGVVHVHDFWRHVFLELLMVVLLLLVVHIVFAKYN